MKQFFKYTLATIVGVVVSFFVVFGIIMIIFSSIASGFGDKEVVVKENSVLKIKLTGEIPDRTSDNPFSNIDFSSFESRKTLGLNDILKNIEKAKKDDRIKGIYLDLSVIPSGIATVEEIRNKLIDFKQSGKFIVSYSDTYSQTAYYLASVSDKVYLNPQGGFDWKGLASQLMFFKRALDKLGVEAQIFRYGEFKSAIEPYVEEQMSDENREQMTELLESMWEEMLKNVSAKRHISIDDLNYYADNLKAFNAETALEYGFIDKIAYYDEFLKDIKKKADLEDDAKEKDFMISMNKYDGAKVEGIKRNRSKNKIAVIFAEGEIVNGMGREGQIGGDRVSKLVRQARLDDDVKAVVLRVNSPGGSALASEIIWREVVLTEKEKPVVVSMGNLAASGGYYIACPANFIYAQPNTITGSIGVFGMMPNLETLMNEKIGITFDVVKTNDMADLGSMMRPITKEEREFIQKQVNDFYETFLTRVADGREQLSYEDADRVGEGRVWSGVTSLDLGLVDGIGGLNDAVNKAVKLAEIEDNDYRIVEYPRKKDFMERLMSDFSIKASNIIIKNIIGSDNYKVYKDVERIKNMNGVQARMDYYIEIF